MNCFAAKKRKVRLCEWREQNGCFYGGYAMTQMEKQRAFDYSMYVMLSSYFDKSVCNEKLQIQKLRLAYQELKDEDKQVYDEQSIRMIEEQLLPNLPKYFIEQKMKLRLLGKEDSKYTEIRLQNENYVLRIKTNYKKKKPILLYEVWGNEQLVLLYTQQQITC